MHGLRNGTPDHDNAVGIYFSSGDLDEIAARANRYGNPDVIRTLQERGVAVYLVGKGAVDLAGGSISGYPAEPVVDDAILRVKPAPQPTELDIAGGTDLQVLRSRLHLPGMLEQDIDIVNGAALRRFGGSKWQQYLAMPEYFPHTMLLGELPLSEQLATLSGDRVVVKRSASQGGNDVRIVTNTEVAVRGAVAELRSKIATLRQKNPLSTIDEDILLQEYVAGQLPPDIRGSDAHNTASIQNTSNLEVRMYCFQGPMFSEVYSVARVFRPLDEGVTNDRWAYISQDGLGDTLPQLARDVAARTLEYVDRSTGYIVPDFFWGQRANDPEPRWLLREINTRDPIMVGSEQHQPTALALRRHMASLLHAAAIAKKPNGR